MGVARHRNAHRAHTQARQLAAINIAGRRIVLSCPEWRGHYNWYRGRLYHLTRVTYILRENAAIDLWQFSWVCSEDFVPLAVTPTGPWRVRLAAPRPPYMVGHQLGPVRPGGMHTPAATARKCSILRRSTIWCSSCLLVQRAIYYIAVSVSPRARLSRTRSRPPCT